MFLPVGDTPNPKNFTPWVTWALIALNIAVYVFISLPLSMSAVDVNDPALLEFLRHIAPSLPAGVTLQQVLGQVSSYDLFIFAHGYKPGAPELGDLFGSLFLHAGFWHLAGNMLFLWIYGDNVENRLGRIGFLLTYLATGAVASWFFALLAAQSMTPLVGASGAISGVLGLYFLLFPKNRVKVFVFLFPFFMDVILLPARLVLGFFILIDNLLPFLVGSQSGVAYGAHIGGFFAGLGVAWVGERFAWHWPWTDRLWRTSRMSRPGRVRRQAPETDRVDRLRAALAEAHPVQAFNVLAGMDQHEMAALEPDECVTLANWLDEAGHPVAAATILRRCIAAHAASSNLSTLYLQLGLMRLKQHQPTAAYQYLLNVFEHDPDEATAEKARDALAQIDIYRRTQ